jgi:hypothetical protein
MWQASWVTMRQSWESEARNWARFAYIRAVEAAGLLTEAIREVGAPGHVVARDPAARRWQRIPLFLHLRAIKPG